MCELATVLFLLQSASQAQDLSLKFLATGPNVIGIQMSFGYNIKVVLCYATVLKKLALKLGCGSPLLRCKLLKSLYPK